VSDIDLEPVVSGYQEVRALLADDRFDVPTAESCDTVGTLAWLRAAGSRFCTGAEHARRRALAVAALQGLDPARLRLAAHGRALAALATAGQSGDEVDAMSCIARAVPMATLAEVLGGADPEAMASAVVAVAAAYFGGADEAVQRLADKATVELVEMLWAGDMDSVVTRVTLMVQACGGTAGLIGLALHALAESPATPTDALLADVVRRTPPVRATRRAANTNVSLGTRELSRGDTVLCDLATASLDASASDGPPLAFGHGIRPCPGERQAMMLAAGVVDAVRDACTVPGGQMLDFEPSPGLQIPQRLVVRLR